MKHQMFTRLTQDRPQAVIGIFARTAAKKRLTLKKTSKCNAEICGG